MCLSARFSFRSKMVDGYDDVSAYAVSADDDTFSYLLEANRNRLTKVYDTWAPDLPHQGNTAYLPFNHLCISRCLQLTISKTMPMPIAEHFRAL